MSQRKKIAKKNMNPLAERAAGVLLHPVSLPSPHGIGDLGPGARWFVRQIAAAGQRWWQMCPLGPTGAGFSPYQTFSAFAGNPQLISLEDLAEEGLLSAKDISRPPAFSSTKVDYPGVQNFKFPLLEKAYRSFKKKPSSSPLRKSFLAFQKTHAGWLPAYAAFSALKEAAGGGPWWEWPVEWRQEPAKAMKIARGLYPDRVGFHGFIQFVFYHQWACLKKEAARFQVGIIGDIPIFVSEDSADVWEKRNLFQVGKTGRVTHVAGVPPDAFSETGQRWGNPLYRWSEHKKTGFDWWVNRLSQTFLLFDAARLDHFIGFYNYWSIPADHPTAERGTWVKAPGLELFERVFKKLGKKALIAEDLGVVTEPVKKLRDRLNLPGMRVLQFAFGDDPEGNNYLPHNYIENCVVYTGTHDNDTMMGWLSAAGRAYPESARDHMKGERANALRYAGTEDPKNFAWDMIRLAYRSKANLAIVPLQDWLGLGSEARLNYPGTVEGNWSWRFERKALKGKIIKDLHKLSSLSGRLPRPLKPRKVKPK